MIAIINDGRKTQMKRNISLIFIFILVISMLSACESTSPVAQPNTAVSPKGEATATPVPVQEESKEIVIADDDYVTATFEKIYDAEHMGVTGVFYLDIKAQNKTDKEIWVYLDKASVNDEMVPMVMSGVPLNIQPEKSGRTGFIISFSSLSIDKVDDVKKIEFDLVVADQETLSELDRVSSIKLDF